MVLIFTTRVFRASTDGFDAAVKFVTVTPTVATTVGGKHVADDDHTNASASPDTFGMAQPLMVTVLLA